MYEISGSEWVLAKEWSPKAGNALDIYWHPAGRYIYAAGIDGVLYVWDAQNLGLCIEISHPSSYLIGGL